MKDNHEIFDEILVKLFDDYLFYVMICKKAD